MPIINKGDYKLLWVVDFPSFEWSEEESRYVACHHPFTMPKDEDIEKFFINVTKISSLKKEIVYRIAFRVFAFQKIEKYSKTFKFLCDYTKINYSLFNEISRNSFYEFAETIFRDFLVEYEADGPKPKRTYIGMKYNDGFSDHLPVKLVLHNNY